MADHQRWVPKDLVDGEWVWWVAVVPRWEAWHQLGFRQRGQQGEEEVGIQRFDNQGVQHGVGEGHAP